MLTMICLVVGTVLCFVIGGFCLNDYQHKWAASVARDGSGILIEKTDIWREQYGNWTI